jgi:hypothetical protein
MSVVATIALYALLACSVSSQAPDFSSCSGHINDIPVWTKDPVFVKEVEFGKLYTGGTGDDQFDILHLYGTPY